MPHNLKAALGEAENETISTARRKALHKNYGSVQLDWSAEQTLLNTDLNYANGQGGATAQTPVVKMTD